MQLHLPQGCTAQHSVLTLTDNMEQTDRQTGIEKDRHMDASFMKNTYWRLKVYFD